MKGKTKIKILKITKISLIIILILAIVFKYFVYPKYFAKKTYEQQFIYVDLIQLSNASFPVGCTPLFNSSKINCIGFIEGSQFYFNLPENKLMNRIRFSLDNPLLDVKCINLTPDYYECNGTIEVV